MASTKAFTCQLSVLACLALNAARAGQDFAEEEREQVKHLAEAPRYASQALKLSKQIERVAHKLSKVNHALYLGRDVSYPLAMEGALKLKEISYIHAEGYAAGELKHGPIALIDENMPVIVIAPHDRILKRPFPTCRKWRRAAARSF